LHQKHKNLTRSTIGEFGRCEIAMLGTPCSTIKALFQAIIQALPHQQIAVVEADHKAEETLYNTLWFTDKINFRRFDYQQDFNNFERKNLFNKTDLVLVNGNHFKAKSQIVVIDPAKSLEKKLDRLTDVRLVIFQEGVSQIPSFLEGILPTDIPIIGIQDMAGLITHIQTFIQASTPPLYGLVLAGGQSKRMGQDKGLLHYHGKDQRTHAFELLQGYCQEVFVSLNAQQIACQDVTLPYIEDTFTNLGPTGGILSAFRHNPNVAWLVVACDLPFLSAQSLDTLCKHRNPSKIATAFIGNQDFPEPLITIWETKAYPVLLQMLSLGYDCPRKTLINHDVECISAPNPAELQNVNDKAAFEAVRLQVKLISE
jgi:molybdenum cofactor guanylyltransferase